MKIYLSIHDLERLSTPEVLALRDFLLDRLACFPEGSPLREGICTSLENIGLVLCRRMNASSWPSVHARRS